VRVSLDTEAMPATVPTLSGSIVFLYSEKFEDSRHFYENDLALEVRKDLGDVVFYILPGSASSLGVVRQGVSAASTPPCSAAQAGKDTVMVCLLSESVCDWHSRLTQRGRSFEQPPQRNDKFGIFNALLRDPDGYLVEIQQFLSHDVQQQFCSKRKFVEAFGEDANHIR